LYFKIKIDARVPTGFEDFHHRQKAINMKLRDKIFGTALKCAHNPQT
jgi:hypothetical protein